MKATRLSGVLELPVEAPQMSEVIGGSIAGSAQELELTEAQRAELDRRLADYAKHPDAGSSWTEVKARILKRS